jgi:hypothetical protein
LRPDGLDPTVADDKGGVLQGATGSDGDAGVRQGDDIGRLLVEGYRRLKGKD